MVVVLRLASFFFILFPSVYPVVSPTSLGVSTLQVVMKVAPLLVYDLTVRMTWVVFASRTKLLEDWDLVTGKQGGLFSLLAESIWPKDKGRFHLPKSVPWMSTSQVSKTRLLDLYRRHNIVSININNTSPYWLKSFVPGILICQKISKQLIYIPLMFFTH